MTKWKLVPVDPTNEMKFSSRMHYRFPEGVNIGGITQWGINTWPEMLSSSPSVPDEVLERMARAAWQYQIDHVSGLKDCPTFDELPKEEQLEEIATMRAALEEIEK